MSCKNPDLIGVVVTEDGEFQTFVRGQLCPTVEFSPGEHQIQWQKGSGPGSNFQFESIRFDPPADEGPISDVRVVPGQIFATNNNEQPQKIFYQICVERDGAILCSPPIELPQGEGKQFDETPLELANEPD